MNSLFTSSDMRDLMQLHRICPSAVPCKPGDPGLHWALAGALLWLCLSSLSVSLQIPLELYSETAAKKTKTTKPSY